jgi:ribosomal subunit interface protein
VDIVVKGRHDEVPDHNRQHVEEKLQKVERYDDKIIGIDVELFHEKNPRQSDRCQRVEITCATRGPLIRAEACAGDFYSALDAAIAKLDARLRRSADRRRIHRGRRAPISVAAATSGLATTELDGFAMPAGALAGVGAGTLPSANGDGPLSELSEDADDQPWHIVRQKEHPTEPMTVDDALFQMELVGHDFYLFMDKESGRPSVVYRRRAYDYGVITLAA